MAMLPELRAHLTRERLASLWAPTYGAVRGVSANEGFDVLAEAFGRGQHLARHQDALLAALREARPDDDDRALAARLTKKGRRTKRVQVARIPRAREAEWLAWTLDLATQAGVASGEAAALLDTDGGQALLAAGLDHACRFGAQELLR
jgi:hypothetical protein